MKNKVGFIVGSIPKLDGEELDLLNSWIINNNVVISWILNSASKDISTSIIFSDSATEIWLDLQNRFQQSNGPHIFQLQQELLNLVQNQNSINVHFTKLKALWNELSKYRPSCTCGQCTYGGVNELSSYFRNEYVMTFLMGLNESYAQIRSQLLMLDPIPQINKVIIITQEERQRTINSPHNNGGIDHVNSMHSWQAMILIRKLLLLIHQEADFLREKGLFALIAIFMDMLLQNVTKYMAIL